MTIEEELRDIKRGQKSRTQRVRKQRDALMVTSRSWQKDDEQARERIAQYATRLRECRQRYLELARRCRAAQVIGT